MEMPSGMAEREEDGAKTGSVNLFIPLACNGPSFVKEQPLTVMLGADLPLQNLRETLT